MPKERTKMEKRDAQTIMREFTVRRTRQIIAIATAVFLVLLFAVLYKRPDLFGEFSKDTLFLAQVLLILAFLNFTAFNWLCPSCKKYLGSDMNRRVCKQCGARLR
jgi:peptidoglycan/LPS O-acetylase OafA/YrhL